MGVKSSDVFRYDPEYVQVAREESAKGVTVVSNVYVASCVVDDNATVMVDLKSNLLGIANVKGSAGLLRGTVVPTPEEGQLVFRNGVLFYSYELKLCVNYETIEEESEDGFSTIHRSVYKVVPMKGSCKVELNSDVPVEKAKLLALELKEVQVSCVSGDAESHECKATVVLDASVVLWMNVLMENVQLE